MLHTTRGSPASSLPPQLALKVMLLQLLPQLEQSQPWRHSPETTQWISVVQTSSAVHGSGSHGLGSGVHPPAPFDVHPDPHPHVAAPLTTMHCAHRPLHVKFSHGLATQVSPDGTRFFSHWHVGASPSPSTQVPSPEHVTPLHAEGPATSRAVPTSLPASARLASRTTLESRLASPRLLPVSVEASDDCCPVLVVLEAHAAPTTTLTTSFIPT